MSATIVRQGVWEQLEQSDICLALNMAKMAKGGYLQATMEQTQQLIKKLCTQVQEEKMREVEFPGHKKMQAAIERHAAMVYKNHTNSFLPRQNGTTKNPQAPWRGKGTGAPPPELPATTPGTVTPPVIPPLHGTPSLPLGYTDRHEHYEIEGMPSSCVYIHSLLPNTHFLNHTAYANDSKHDTDCIPDCLCTLSAA
jgi:hypothetical protein